jgi:hypothetical protein
MKSILSGDPSKDYNLVLPSRQRESPQLFLQPPGLFLFFVTD